MSRNENVQGWAPDPDHLPGEKGERGSSALPKDHPHAPRDVTAVGSIKIADPDTIVHSDVDHTGVPPTPPAYAPTIVKEETQISAGDAQTAFPAEQIKHRPTTKTEAHKHPQK